MEGGWIKIIKANWMWHGKGKRVIYILGAHSPQPKIKLSHKSHFIGPAEKMSSLSAAVHISYSKLCKNPPQAQL
jgi:hypothetical protein